MKKLGLLLLFCSPSILAMNAFEGDWGALKEAIQRSYDVQMQDRIAQMRSVKDDPLFEDWRYHEEQEAKRKAAIAKKKAAQKKYEAEVAAGDKKDR